MPISNRMQAVFEADILGWDYHTYMNQPKWFIELSLKKQSVEAELQKKQT